jgi:alkylation response protein AidB-like acyl-CoA dehydrogenase
MTTPADQDMVSSSFLAELAALGPEADGQSVWPEASWDVLRRAGVLGWVIAHEFGGQGSSPAQLLHGYEQLAGSCLTTCFILSQREAACRRISESGQAHLCRELLPPLARGETFATVGLSHLTTSRQHTGPSLRVRETRSCLVLHGEIPWVTGAARAQHFVVGATLDDGRQVLLVLPADLSGVSVRPSLQLMALQGSITAEIKCEDVAVDRRWLLAGPAERVVQIGRGGTGGLETSCLALGLADAAIGFLEGEAALRTDLLAGALSLRRQQGELRDTMHRLLAGALPAEETMTLRARANTLVLGATQAALTASKGTGFLLRHPAQRWARQALFFLVWSCPWPAASAVLARLTEAPACS